MPRRRLWVALLVLPLLQACAYSMVQGDHVRADAFDEVLARTAAARDLPVPEHYETKVITRDAIPDLLREAIVAGWSTQELADYQDALVAIGAWPADRDLVEEYVAVSREELAGLYVPADVTLYLLNDAPTPFSVKLLSAMTDRDLMLEFILAHELIHLLQHGAYPGLLEDDADWRDQDDAAYAVHAAIEGDATHYGLVAVVGTPYGLPSGEEFRTDMEIEDRGNDGALARAPALLRLTLAFPYAWGYGLSLSEGPALLDEPPASTEQVLHMEKRSEPFLAIDLEPARSALPRGCRWLGDNTMGELGISVLLRDLGDAPTPAAWHGWDGDRYLAARCGERRAFLWETHWDSDTDATEFATAYAGIAARVGQRAGLDQPLQIRRNGRRVRIVTEPLLPLADSLDTHSRRRQVTTLPQLRRHFGAEVRER